MGNGEKLAGTPQTCSHLFLFPYRIFSAASVTRRFTGGFLVFPSPVTHHYREIGLEAQGRKPERRSYKKAAAQSVPCKNPAVGTSPMVQWLRLRASDTADVGSIPGRGTKIPHATRHGQKQRNKQKCPVVKFKSSACLQGCRGSAWVATGAWTPVWAVTACAWVSEGASWLVPHSILSEIHLPHQLSFGLLRIFFSRF